MAGTTLLKSAAVLVLSAVYGSGQIITTAAGTDWLFPGNGPALNAPLSGSYGVFASPSGNIYISDGNDIVGRVSPDGYLTVVAGNGLAGYSGDGGPALNASLNAPTGLAMDSSGALYVCENFNFRIRRISPDGTISTIAGTGRAGFSGDNEPAVNAKMGNVHGIAVAADGTIFFADFGNNRIRKISPAGIISTYAGDGMFGFGGDGGPATMTSLAFPTGISLDSAGNLYIADQQNGRIRKVSTNGIITTVGPVGGCPTGVAADGKGGVYVADPCQRIIQQFTAGGSVVHIGGNRSGINEPSGDGGQAVNASFDEWSISLANDGTLWISGPDYGRLYRIAPSGTFSIVAGNGQYLNSPAGTPAKQAYLSGPNGVTTDSAGNLYIADSGRNRVRKVTPDGIISTIAGTGRGAYSGDNGPAVNAMLSFPAHVRLDSAGNIYIADQYNNRIRRVDTKGVIMTVAGSGSATFSGDQGPATRAALNGPVGVVVDSASNIYIADGDNHRVRKVSSNGTISTIAGTGTAGYSGDGGKATDAMLNHPASLDLDSAGNLYIADDRNHRIRKVSPDGTITTFAGNGNVNSSGDNGPATSAGLRNPYDVFVAKDNSVFIADPGADRIRRVDPQGIITTVAGNGSFGLSGDGGIPTAASLKDVRGVTMTASGTVYIGDTSNNRIREILTGPIAYQASPLTLNFSGTANGSPTAPQSVALSSSIIGLPFTASVNQNWITVSPSPGAMPAALQITAFPNALNAGTYQANVTINVPNGMPPTTTIAVTFVVQPPATPALGVSSQNLSLRVTAGGGIASQLLSVLNTGNGSFAFTASAATSTGGGWLSVSPASGTVTSATPAVLSVLAAPGSLAVGTYNGTITVTGAGDTIRIPVTMSVNPAAAIILLSQSGIRFNAVAQGGSPLPQTFGILNTGQGSMDWSAKAVTLSGGNNWLQISPASGTVSQPYLDVSIVSVTVNASGLAPGDYYGRIQVAALATNTPQLLTVVLSVFPPGSNPGPELQPSGVIFTGAAGVTPGSQDVTLGNPTAQPTNYVSSVIARGFTYLPASANVLPNQPATLRVYPDFSNLRPGEVDHGAITLLFSDGTIRNVSVLTVVAPAASATANSRLEPQAANCSSAKLEVQWRAPLANFTAVLGQPTTLQVQVVDDCGNPIGPANPKSASVQATFSNRDADLTLTHTGNGIWAGTWKPVKSVTGQVTATVSAFNSTGQVLQSGQISLSGSLSASATPVVTAGGVVHAASAVGGAPIAPGSLITIYGTNLADSQGQSSTLPLPQSENGVQVFMGNTPLPILYTSTGQLNVQVPFSTPVNTDYQISVQRDSLVSMPEQLVVAQANPGVFTVNQQGSGQGVIFKSDGVTLAQPGSPANQGETVVIYCTGLGAVTPAVADGAPASATTLSNTVNTVTATIGGQNAAVSYSGLTPGFPGLYQVNAAVPMGVSGDAVPVVVSVAGQTSRAVIIAVQ